MQGQNSENLHTSTGARHRHDSTKFEKKNIEDRQKWKNVISSERDQKTKRANVKHPCGICSKNVSENVWSIRCADRLSILETQNLFENERERNEKSTELEMALWMRSP